MTDLPFLNFRGGVGVETQFGANDLRGSNFTETVLRGASFRGTDLTASSFVNAILNGADFEGANLRGVDFRGAYLVNVQGLTAEQLMQVRLEGARAIVTQESSPGLEQLLASRFGETKDTKDILQMLDPVPVSFDQIAGRLQGNRIFRGLYAANLIANQSDFTGSDFTGATFEGIVANQSLFRAATLGGVLIRGSALREADLVSAWAPGITLEDVDLTGANVANANLVGAVLREVNLKDVIGLDADKTNLEGIVIEDSCRLPQGYSYDGVTLQRSDKLNRQLNS